MLEHKVDFIIPFDPQSILNNQGDLTDTELHDHIFIEVHKFLVEAVSNVASAAFKFLNQKELTENEVKEYAAKNILLNINSVFRQLNKAIVANPSLKEVVKETKMAEFRLRLIKELDETLKSILENMADSYPMAPATGGTQKMRENVHDINRTDNENYDFIRANGISIKPYINEEGDYTEFIMQVINAAIRATDACS